MSIQNRAVLLAALVAFGLSMAGCANTIRGVGRDLENTGDAIADAAS
jgi:predicted small secreted protein